MTTINLSNLFEIQRKLDAEIERKHPSVDGEDRLAKRILALQVELGECANEWRGFKFWSTNQESKGSTQCPQCLGTRMTDYAEVNGMMMIVTKPRMCRNCMGSGVVNPLLEEFADCLHFILSVGLEINFTKYNLIGSYETPGTIEDMFLLVNEEIAEFSKSRRQKAPVQYLHMFYSVIFDALIALGEMLGFTWEQIELAYSSKNAKNWVRQAEGY